MNSRRSSALKRAALRWAKTQGLQQRSAFCSLSQVSRPGASYADSSPYAQYVAKAAAPASKDADVSSPSKRDSQQFFERSWLRPRSVFDQEMVSHLCTGKYRTTWKGTGLMKCPTSLVQYQQLLQKIRPKTIFDLGTCGGGSALWLADQCAALGLRDTKVVTMDIQDLRPEDVRKQMDEHPNILFLEGDAFKVSQLLEEVQRKGVPLQHPWLISEDCHLDSFPLLTQFRFAGMQPGDYIVFEDTHVDGPDEAGMSGEDPSGYRTGNFSRGKYDQVCWAMMPFAGEYEVDTEIQDMFGENGSLLANSVFKQVRPPPRSSVTQVEYTCVESLRAAAPVIEAALSVQGACLLRYLGRDTSEDRVESLLPELRVALGVAIAADYQASGGSDLRPQMKGKAVAATAFPSESFIPPHHELMYTPNSPDRAAFVSVLKATAGGSTTVYDSVAALKVLHSAADSIGCPVHKDISERCKKNDKLVYRRTFTPPGNNDARVVGNTIKDWGSLLGDVPGPEAMKIATAKGFTAELMADGSLQLDYASPVVCEKTGALTLSVTSQDPVIYDVFYRDGSEPAHNDTWWESDGSKVTKEQLMVMVAVYCQTRLPFELNSPGDAILIDNRRMAHGRMPFKPGSKRKTAVIMGQVQ